MYDFTSTANSQQIDYSFELFDLISMTCKSLDNGKLSFYCNYYNMKSFAWTSIFLPKLILQKSHARDKKKIVPFFFLIYFHGQLDDDSQPVSM